MNEDGTMARLPQLVEIAKKFDLKIISIATLISYRLKEESIVEKGETVDLPTAWGDFRITPFRQKSNGLEHVALTKGEWTEDEPVLTRVHSVMRHGRHLRLVPLRLRRPAARSDAHDRKGR